MPVELAEKVYTSPLRVTQTMSQTRSYVSSGILVVGTNTCTNTLILQESELARRATYILMSRPMSVMYADIQHLLASV